MPLPLQHEIAATTSEPVQPANAVTQSWKLLGEVEAAIRTGDVKTLRTAAKALKGSITSVLAQQAFEAASILENVSDEGRLEQALHACQRLRQAIYCLHPASAQKGKV